MNDKKIVLFLLTLFLSTLAIALTIYMKFDPVYQEMNLNSMNSLTQCETWSISSYANILNIM